MSNNEKLEAFIEIAKSLNRELGSAPILYGSLGLSKALNVEIDADDIDLLIEDNIFSSDLDKICGVMESLGFTLVNPEENEFHLGTLKVGMSHDGDMVAFCGVDPSRLEVVEQGAKYRVLTPQDYLQTYRASSLDGYRRDKRQKNDAAKIKLLESYISELQGVRTDTSA